MNIQQARTLVVGQIVYWYLYSHYNHKCFTIKEIDRGELYLNGRFVKCLVITDGNKDYIVTSEELNLESR